MPQKPRPAYPINIHDSEGNIIDTQVGIQVTADKYEMKYHNVRNALKWGNLSNGYYFKWADKKPKSGTKVCRETYRKTKSTKIL